MKTIDDLTAKQKVFINDNDIVVEKNNDPGNPCYVFLIAGAYNQQKGFGSEYDAYCAAINFIINKK